MGISLTKKTEDQQAKRPDMIGSDATTIYGGYVHEEYLRELVGKQAVNVYEEMRRGDSQVRMVLSAIKNPIKSAKFKHEPADDSDQAKEIAEFLDWHWFKNPFFNFAKWINEALTFIEFGYSLHEYAFTTYDHRDHGLVTVVGAMAFRRQRSIEQWLIDGSKGLTGVRQYAYGDTVDAGKQEVVIPVERLCIFVNDQEGENYEGMSMLRPAYGAWFRKKHAVKMLMIGAEKAAIGVPIGSYTGTASDDDRKDFETILGNFAAHELSYLMAPNGYTIDWKQVPFDAEKLMAIVHYEDAQIAKGPLMAFLELGQNGNGGAYSLGEDQSELAMGSLQYIGDMIAAKMQELNERLVEWNFGDPDLTPRAMCTGINRKAATKLVAAIQTLAGAQVIRPDDTLEGFMRESLGLPKAETTRAEAAEAAGLPGGDPNADPAADPKDPQTDPSEEDDPPAPPAKKFTDPPAWTPWRALSVYEQPLAFSDMIVENRDASAKISAVMRTQTAALAAHIVRQLGKRFAQSQRSRIKIADSIPIETREYEKSLLRAMVDAVATGSKQAKRDLAAKTTATFAEPKTSKLEFLPQHVQEGLKAQAKKQAEANAAELKKIMDFNVISANDTQLPDDEIISKVEDGLNEYVAGPKIENAARTIAVQAVDRGRDGFFFDPENIKEIQAFQYSAVLDDRTTDICLSLDGQIFKASDPAVDRLRPPNHFGCRSILVPITVNEPAPKLTGLQVDPTNQSLKDEYERRGTEPPDMQKILKSRNL